MLSQLIDKTDTFEDVRDQLAAILALESENQMTLAQDAGRDPQNWALRVFTERSNAWDYFLDGPAVATPIVNVWFESAAYEARASNVMERQLFTATYFVDCYGYAPSAQQQIGHLPGDEQAAKESQRAARLARNIIMAAENTYLQLPRDVFSGRWVESIETFQPTFGNNNAIPVVATRLRVRTKFNEFSPQTEAKPLQLLTAQITRASDGALLGEMNLDYIA